MNSTKDNWIKALVKLFDGNDGTIMPTWLLCYNGELDSDPPFDCGCCLDGHRNDRKDCGCVCHKRFEKIIAFISQVEKDAIEKTNKRWREKCEKLIGEDEMLIGWGDMEGRREPMDDAKARNNLRKEQRAKLSDLLEDKK